MSFSTLPFHPAVTSTQDAQTTSVAVEKQAETGAPLRLMTQFLRAVSENRMEDALALAQTGRAEDL